MQTQAHKNECEHYFYLKEGDPNTIKCIYCGYEEPAEENPMLKL